MSLGILTNVAATYAQNNLNRRRAVSRLFSNSFLRFAHQQRRGRRSRPVGCRRSHANVAALTQSAQNAQNGCWLAADR